MKETAVLQWFLATRSGLAERQDPDPEEIRIQILECFAQQESPSARMNDRRAVLGRVRVPTGQVHHLGGRDNNATL